MYHIGGFYFLDTPEESAEVCLMSCGLQGASASVALTAQGALDIKLWSLFGSLL